MTGESLHGLQGGALIQDPWAPVQITERTYEAWGPLRRENGDRAPEREHEEEEREPAER